MSNIHVEDENEELEKMRELEYWRLVQWLLNNGRSEEEAYACLAFTLNATPEQHRGE